MFHSAPLYFAGTSIALQHTFLTCQLLPITESQSVQLVLLFCMFCSGVWCFVLFSLLRGL